MTSAKTHRNIMGDRLHHCHNPRTGRPGAVDDDACWKHKVVDRICLGNDAANTSGMQRGACWPILPHA